MDDWIDGTGRRSGRGENWRLGTNTGSEQRYLGIADSSRGQAVVDLLVEAGFGTDGRADDLSDGYISLYDGDGVDFSITVLPDGGKDYAPGRCTTAPEGAVSIWMTAGGG